MAKPEIRLKGFDGEWSPTTIGEIADVIGGGTPSTSVADYWNGKIQWFTPSEVGKTRYVSTSERTLSNEGLENSSAKMIPAYSILLSSRATVGEASINTRECCTNQGFQSLVPRIVDLDFLYSLVSTIKKDIVRESSGSTFIEISANKVRGLNVTIPNLSEQKALGVIFKSLDSLILATTKKITSLKLMKSAFLTSMFPQAGETTPRVRFKGFEGDWDKKLLNECLDISRKRNTDDTYGKDDVLSVSDDFGVMNQIELLGRSYAGKSVSNYGILEHGQLVYTKSPLKSKPYGIVKENHGKTGIVSVLYAIYTAKENTWIPYIHYYFDPAWRLNAYLRPLINKGAKNTMNISDETALTGYIMIPKDIKEQQRIGSYFRSLDKQISLQEQRLEKLKQIKAACLDKMFV